MRQLADLATVDDDLDRRHAAMIIVIHAGFALVSIPLGAYLLLRAKGTPAHRLLGKIYLGFMLVIAVSAIFIQELTPGRFSMVHLFIPWTLFWVPFAMWSIHMYKKTGDIRWRYSHRNSMIGLYFGGLLVAGTFTLLPGRVIHNLLFL